MKWIQKTFFALGTVNSIIITCEDEFLEVSMKAAEQIKNKVMDLDDRLSVFKPRSEISQINKSAGKEFVKVHPDTYRLILSSVQYGDITDGAFDITIRPLSKLWGIGKKGEFIPKHEEISEAMELVNYKDIIFDEKTSRIKLKKPGQSIDLGGIAKGFAADEAKKILINNNLKDAIINFGGTITVIGKEKKIGIQHPGEITGTSMGVITIKEKAVVTSGWNENYFIKNGVRYHHIINPKTGMPTEKGLGSVTLLGKSAMELDALATAVFALGIDKGNSILVERNIDGIFALAANRSKKDEMRETYDVFISPNIKNTFHTASLCDSFKI